MVAWGIDTSGAIETSIFRSWFGVLSRRLFEIHAMDSLLQCFSCSMYKFIPPVVVLAPHDSNVAVYRVVKVLKSPHDSCRS